MTIEQTVERYGFSQVATQSGSSELTRVEEARAIQEVQASVIMAKKFRRDVNESFLRIIEACKRPSLAEASQYAYPRGGKTVRGPSIRLAEVLAQNFGNMLYGVEEISQQNGVSVAQAFAWDIETNVKVTKKFHVPHKRFGNGKITELTDPRDIYELVANQGARRLRSCILQLIPVDIKEAAIEECEKTIKGKNTESIQDRVKKLIVAFKDYGVSISDIEENIGHPLDTIIESELVDLRAIYRSIKDGVVNKGEFFGKKKEAEKKVAEEEGKTKTDKVANKLANKKVETIDKETGEVKELTEEEEKSIDEFMNSGKKEAQNDR